jgi:transcriptional regulator with XRE-family HTH domain
LLYQQFMPLIMAFGATSPPRRLAKFPNSYIVSSHPMREPGWRIRARREKQQAQTAKASLPPASSPQGKHCDMTKAHPGNRIRELRRKIGLTAKELAERINTTESTVSRIESGKQNLTQAWLIKIASALGVKLTEILEDDSVEAPAAPACEYVKVRGRIEPDRWLDGVFYDELKSYDIPLVGLKNAMGFKLAAFEYMSPWQGWVIGCEMPKLLTADFAGKEFVVCRHDTHKHYELSLRHVEIGPQACYLVSDKGDPSNRIVRADDEGVCALWRVLLRCEAYFQSPFPKMG